MTAKRPAAAGKRARKRKEPEPVIEEEEEAEGGEAEELADDPVIEPETKASKRKSSLKSSKPPSKMASRGQFLEAGSEAAAKNFVPAMEQVKDGALVQARFQDAAGKLVGKCLLESIAVQDLGGHAVIEGRLLARTGIVPKHVKQLKKDADILVHLCRFSKCTGAPTHPDKCWVHLSAWRPLELDQITSDWMTTPACQAWCKRRRGGKETKPRLIVAEAEEKSVAKPRTKRRKKKVSFVETEVAAEPAADAAENSQVVLEEAPAAEAAAAGQDGRSPVMDRLAGVVTGGLPGESHESRPAISVQELKERLRAKKDELKEERTKKDKRRRGHRPLLEILAKSQKAEPEEDAEAKTLEALFPELYEKLAGGHRA